MKKLISVIAVLALVLAMSVPAFAAEALTGNSATGKGANDYTIGVNGVYNAGSAAQDVISVDIAWESMEFTYNAGSAGTWNPGTHQYDAPVDGSWEINPKKFTLKNHSNVAVNATFAFAGASEGITGTFGKKLENGTMATYANGDLTRSLASAVGTTVENAPTEDIWFTIDPDAAAISESGSLGTITITIAKKPA